MVRKRRTTPSKSKVQNVETDKAKLTFNGILYKSGLEVYCAKALTAAGLPVHYEQVAYTLQPGFSCPTTSWEAKEKKVRGSKEKVTTYGPVPCKVLPMKYTPDFTGPGWVVETKGWASPEFQIRFKVWKYSLLQDPNPPTIFLPRNRAQVNLTIQAIQQLTKNP